MTALNFNNSHFEGKTILAETSEGDSEETLFNLPLCWPALGIEAFVEAPRRRRERLPKARPFWVTPKLLLHF